jgi:VIT1/CCC1 family predicted Fe2+/Mn2+ transporter
LWKYDDAKLENFMLLLLVILAIPLTLLILGISMSKSTEKPFDKRIGKILIIIAIVYVIIGLGFCGMMMT